MNRQLKCKMLFFTIFYTTVAVFGMDFAQIANILQLPQEIFAKHIVENNLLKQNPLYRVAILKQVCKTWYEFLKESSSLNIFLKQAYEFNCKLNNDEGDEIFNKENIQSPFFDIKCAEKFINRILRGGKGNLFIELLVNDDYSLTPAMVKYLVTTTKCLIVHESGKNPRYYTPIKLVIQYRKNWLVENFILHEASKFMEYIDFSTLIKEFSVYECNMLNLQEERPLCLALQRISSVHECTTIFCSICGGGFAIAKCLLEKGVDPLLLSVVGKNNDGSVIRKSVVELVQEQPFDSFSKLRKSIVDPQAHAARLQQQMVHAGQYADCRDRNKYVGDDIDDHSEDD